MCELLPLSLGYISLPKSPHNNRGTMNLNTIPILENIQGPWSQTTIKLAGETIVLQDVYPFISDTDCKRLIWIQHGKGDPRFAPERIFLGVPST